MDATEQKSYPFLGIRQRVLFPGFSINLKIGRPKSIRLAQSLYNKQGQHLLFVTTFVPLEREKSINLDTVKIPPAAGKFENDDEDVEENQNVFRTGVLAVVTKLSKVSDYYRMTVQGIDRAELLNFTSFAPFMRARIKRLSSIATLSTREKALTTSLRKSGKEFAKRLREERKESSRMRQLTKDIAQSIENVRPVLLADLLVQNVDSTLEEKQLTLAEKDLQKRLEVVNKLVQKQLLEYEIHEKVENEMKNSIKNTQKEFMIRRQMKALQAELDEVLKEKGEEVDKSDNDILAEKISKLVLPPDTLKIVERELNRMKAIQPSQPEYNVIKTFLDVVVDLPWNKYTNDNLDIAAARAQLERDHFGLQKVKKRILEFLSVMALNKKQEAGEKFTAPILCLAGPPGVGKTSLGKSVAAALGRKFVRFSLGGVRDEAEIRGHRKTYIGAMPGKIISTFKKCESLNPVILLDEIDKVSSQQAARQGDVSSALLEVLDPEQNSTFTDHYLGFPFDISQALFIATANDLSTIPGPLMDRMEVIEIPSYTTKEKIEIARHYLIPKQLKKHSIPLDIKFESAAVSKIISNYTREAGVRSLERQVAAICRDLAVKVLQNQTEKENDLNSVSAAVSEADDEISKHQLVKVITEATVEDILGTKRFVYDSELVNLQAMTSGVSIGLAYTRFGGDVLFIETALHYGNGQVKLTGSLGQVMSESVNAAFTFIKSNVGELQLSKQFDNIQALLTKIDVHVHFPSGAVPKDGPSAGVAICASILSAISGRLIRSDTACTGEISLRGKVLPVGGIKEKVLAAHRAGLKRVVLPQANAKDISEIPEDVRNTITLIPCDGVIEALHNLFNDDDDLSAKPKWYYDFPEDELPSGTARGNDVLLKRHGQKAPSTNTNSENHSKDLCGPILRSLL